MNRSSTFASLLLVALTATFSAGCGGGGASANGDGGATESLASQSLSGECTAECNAQTTLACTTGVVIDECEASCISEESVTPSTSVSCSADYDALAACEAKLSSAQWSCSTQTGNPIPKSGECTTTVCKWVCCVGSGIADPALWTACMSTCP